MGFRASVAALLLLAQLALAGCGGDASQPPIARLRLDATIVAFGDSLTAGTGTSAEQAYPAVLSQLTGRKVINAGVPGETTEQGMHRLSPVLDETTPQLVILCLGGNDMLRRLDRATMKANLAAMLDELKRRSIPVVLLAVPEPALMSLKPDPVYRELADRYRVPLENDAFAESLGDRSLKSDQIHLNAEGYRQVAEAVAKLLKKTGAV